MIKVRLGRAPRARPGTVLPRGGRVLGEIEEYFAETMTPGDTFLFAGEVLRFEGIHEDEVAGRRARAPAPTRRSRPMRAASSRSRPSWPSGCARSSPTRSSGTACRRSSPTGCLQRGARSSAGAARPPGRDLPARRPPLSHLLPVRGPPRAPDPRHAADPPPRAGAAEAARLRRQRLRARGLRPRRRRRPRGRASPASSTELFGEDMLGDDLEDWLAESALMKRTFRYLRGHRGPDRAPLPGPGEDRPAGHDLDRPRLRRAAQARARPRAAAGRAGGCGNGTPRRAGASA